MIDIRFAKMQSCGNDFVVIDAVRQVLPDGINFAALADRKLGIGCDQILILRAAGDGDGFDFGYQIINADGGEVGQCGNGARCAFRFLHRYGLTDKGRVVLQTSTARIVVEAAGDEVRAYLPVPCFFAPVGLGVADRYFVDSVFDGRGFCCLSLGNPHAVFIVDDESLFLRLGEVGGLLNDSNPLFPDGVNVGFGFVRNDGLELRVFERGVGITDACGSGAAAAAVVAVRGGLLKSPVEVKMPGGNLICGWDSLSSPVWLQGAVAEVFSGIVKV